MAHGFCFMWEPGLVWLHVASDIVTGISYYSIALAMLYCSYKRRDITFIRLLFIFAAFITMCGTTHLFAVYTIFDPLYWQEGYVKALTALISVSSAIYFIPQIPKALVMPSLKRSLADNQELNAQLKRTVDELRKSNSFSQSIIDSSIDCIKLLDMEGKLLYINPGGQKLLGINNMEKYLNILYENFWNGRYRELALEAVHNARLGYTGNFEGCCQTTDGASKWFDVIITPVKAASGKTESLLAISRDITERKQIQELAALDEARLESLLRISQQNFSSTQELLDYALQETIMLTESRFGYLFYYDEKRRELKLISWSKDVMDVCKIADCQTTYQLDKTGIWGEAVRQRRPIIINSFDQPNPLEKGYPEGHVKLHSFMTIPIFIRDAIVAVMGVANKDADYTETDLRQLTLIMDDVWKIAEQTKTDQALLSSETKFRNLLESIQLLAIMLDTDGNITFCNDYLLNLTGWSREEIVGKNWFDLFIPETERPQSKSGFSENLANEEMKHFENIILTRNGKQRLIAWDRTPLYGTEGEVIGIASIGTDLTVQKKIEEQLLQSLKMESVGRLAGGVAHDFNNMLNVIMGYAELATLELTPDNPLMEKMMEILKAAERSQKITRQLLAFSRKELISPKKVDLNKLITETTKTLTRLIGEDIQLDLRLTKDLWATRIDPSQVDQILVNLAVNARDAMPKGGQLIIATANSRLDDIYCDNNLNAKSGDYLQLSVSDNGIGMDPQTMEYIFEPFYTTKGVGSGTGLGLSTVYGIVTQNEGFIEVESEIGRGTEFTIYLPRTTTDDLAQESGRETAKTNCYGTILIVEDEDMVRHVTAKMLEHLGYTVLQADTYQVALSISEDTEQEIDLLLTDVIMPTMTGKELFARIKTIRPDIKVLFMSGYTADVIAQRAVLEDDMHFMQKPFEIHTLESKVREVIKS